MTNNGYIYRDIVRVPADGMAVLDFYATRYPRHSREEWQRRIESGRITIHQRCVSCDTRLKSGDELAYHRPPWVEPDVPLDFKVCYSDDHLLVVSKPSGLPVIPRDVFLEHTLLNLVRRDWGDSCTPMHRLDRGTSGLVLFARSRLSRKSMGAAMQHGHVRKTYLARVSGPVKQGTLELAYPMGLVDHPLTGKAWSSVQSGRESRTRCRLISRLNRNEHLVMVRLLTGRPHQIRIHLSAAGMPLTGDPMYGATGGKPDPAAVPGVPGFYLHAWRLRFQHPISGTPMRITAEIPDPLMDSIEREMPCSI